MTPDDLQVRPYQKTDRDAVYDVSIRTAHADHHSRNNPLLETVPVVFAGPYLALEPDLAFVLTHHSRVVGFIVGTADTAQFVRGFRRHWLPQVAADHPPLDHPATTPAEHRITMLHQPEWMLVPELAPYPAHLHINILRDHQRRGGGRALMTAFLDALASRGGSAVHLGVPEHNAGARAFYATLGFRQIPVPDRGLIYLVRQVAVTGLPERRSHPWKCE